MADRFTIIEFGTEEKTPSMRSGVPKVELGDLLGCENIRARVWYLEPSDLMTYHRQCEQEEIYIPVGETGELRIGDEIINVPGGTAVRVPPETPRQLTNEDEILARATSFRNDIKCSFRESVQNLLSWALNSPDRNTDELMHQIEGMFV